MEANKIKVGIPRALLYFKYGSFWIKFFNYIGCEVVVSPNTNKKILDQGLKLSVDESCLSTKIYLGHVAELLEKNVDYIHIPNFAALHSKEKMCVRLMSLGDIVRNTLGDIKILEYVVNKPKLKFEFFGLLKISRKLHVNFFKFIKAYLKAKSEFKKESKNKFKKHLQAIEKMPYGKPKILIVSHPYTTYDNLLGEVITKFLKSQGVELIYSDAANSEKFRKISKNISRDLYWTYNKELLGAIEFYKPYVDGIIFLMVFPCGPDALVINLCQNKLKDILMCVITLDELQGEGGLKTRLESFVDILKLRI